MPTSITTPNSSSTFTPSVHATREREGIYDVVVDALAPNSCYKTAGYALEMPPGVALSIPEYAHLVCKAEYTGGLDRMCLMYLKPLRWDCQDLNFGTGKSHVVVHVVIGSVLAGSTLVKLPVEPDA